MITYKLFCFMMAIPFTRAARTKLKSHKKRQRLAFFTGLPAEVRIMIYKELFANAIVTLRGHIALRNGLTFEQELINWGSWPALKTTKEKLRIDSSAHEVPMTQQPGRSHPVMTAFLISKQFTLEVHPLFLSLCTFDLCALDSSRIVPDRVLLPMQNIFCQPLFLTRLRKLNIKLKHVEFQDSAVLGPSASASASTSQSPGPSFWLPVRLALWDFNVQELRVCIALDPSGRTSNVSRIVLERKVKAFRISFEPRFDKGLAIGTLKDAGLVGYGHREGDAWVGSFDEEIEDRWLSEEMIRALR